MRSGIVLLLALCGLAAAGKEDELAGLVDRLGETDYARRDRAYRELLRRKDPKVVPLILGAIHAFPPANQNYALILVANLPPKVSRPALRTLAGSDDPYLRLSAAIYLHQRGDRERTATIVDALSAEGVDESRLGFMIGRTRMLDLPEIHDALRKLLTSKRGTMNIYSLLDGFGRAGYAGAMAEARALLADARPGVRAVVLAYLIRFGEAERIGELAEVIGEGGLDVSSFTRAMTLLEALRVEDERIVEAIARRCREESNASLAAAMVRALAAQRWRKAIPMLKELVEDERPLVTKAAFEALIELRAAPDADALARMLAGDDPSRALQAARALRRMDDRSGLDMVIRIARLEPDLRRDAVEILGGFRDAKAIEPLLEAMLDEDVSTRSYAERGLRATLQTVFPYRRFDLGATGYDARRSKAERSAAVERIRAWWNEHRDADW